MEATNRVYLNPEKKTIFYYPNTILGSGGFGTVYKGMDLSRNKYAAIKKMIVPEKMHQAFKKEIRIMKELKHPNIIELWDYEEKLNVNQGYIVMQLCQSGTLEDEIKSCGVLPQQKCLIYLKQIVDATDYVSSKEFIHRDLKSENILISQDKTLKICDFGVAKVVKPEQINKMTNGIGTPRNMAPEVLKGTNYDKQCDVWSIGIIFYQMITGDHFFNKMDANIFDLIIMHNNIQMQDHYELEGDYNQFFKEVIRRTIVSDPHKRITIKELKQLVYQQLAIRQHKNNQTQAQNNGGSFGTIPKAAAQNLKNKIKIVYEKKTKQQQPKESQLELKKKNITQLEIELDKDQKSKKYLALFKNLYHYQSARASLFVNYSQISDDQKETHLSNKCLKYIYLGMCMALYALQMQSMQPILTQPVLNIIGFDPMYISEFSDNVREQLLKLREEDLDYVNKNVKPYIEIIIKVYQKLTSAQYNTAGFVDTKFFFRNVIAEFKYISQNKKFSQSKPWFLKWFRKIYYQFQPMKNLDLHLLSDTNLRLYWIFLKLANLQQEIPLSKFQDDNLIGRIKDFFDKGQLQNVRLDIDRLKGKAA